MFQPADSPEPTHNIGHFGCATCHGAQGQGGAAPYVITDALGNTRQVQWAAPPLNTVMLRYTADTVRTILIFGRANTPMPAWGVAGGGAMNDQQIADLVEYLKSITLTPEKAAAQQQSLTKAELQRQGKSVVDGQVLFNVNCARCHTKGWSYGEPEVSGGGAYGPNLTNGDTLRQFPDRSDQIDFVTKGAEFGKPYGVRGIGNQAPAVRTSEDPGQAMQGGGMPYFGSLLTPDQIQAVVDYERSL
jgi:mono/diheme cytochrome c family protein